jgi:hypothetical protein
MSNQGDMEYKVATSYKRPTVQGVVAALKAAGVPIKTQDGYYYDNKAQASKRSSGANPMEVLVDWYGGTNRDSFLLGKVYFDNRLVQIELRRILIEAGYRVVLHKFCRWGDSIDYDLLVLAEDAEFKREDTTDEEIMALCHAVTIEHLKEKIAANESKFNIVSAPFLKTRAELTAQLEAAEGEGTTE